MATRTVRLDQQTEKILLEVRRRSRLSISDALKRGLLALEGEMARRNRPTPYDVYRRLDLGPGGYATAPSTRTRKGVLAALKRKHGR